MSKAQKVKKLSGELYGLVDTLNTAIEDGEYGDALSLIKETYGILGNLEEQVDNLYESYFC